MNEIKLNKSDVCEIEKKASSTKVKYDNVFYVMPDDVSKAIIISPSVPGATLKLGIKEAEVLVKILEQQIRLWR